MIIFNFLYEFLSGKIVILTASNIYNKRKKIFNVVVNASLVRSFRFSLVDVAACLFFCSFCVFFSVFFGSSFQLRNQKGTRYRSAVILFPSRKDQKRTLIYFLD